MGQSRRCIVRLTGSVASTIGAIYTLASEESHHLRDVLRLPLGSEVHIIDRGGLGAFRAEIVDCQESVKLKILEQLPAAAFRSKVRTLAFGLAKGEKNDLVCEKACELGAESIIIWQAERSVPRLDPDNIKKKTARFERILESASAQCGREDVPTITVVQSLALALSLIKQSHSTGERLLTLSLAKGSRPFTLLGAMTGAHLVVGPEGDFSPAEEKLLELQGFEAVTLGPLTLRCETAAIAAVASINAVWGFLENSQNES